MRRTLRLCRLVPVLIAVALAAAGCGGSRVSEGKRGGTLSYLWGADIDRLDPGQTYVQAGIALQRAVNRTLYSISPEGGTQPVPDLADGPPEISQDGERITVHLRRGVRYAPPVGRAVKAQDVKYAIERAFTTNVAGPYARAYFAEIEGAPARPVEMSRLVPFSGLQTPDDLTLVIKLTEPVAQRVAAALVLPITVPVPEEYAAKHDAERPTSYDRHVAFTGPYMVRNDPRTGRVTGHRRGSAIELVRNPRWDPKTDFRPAFLDRIRIVEGNDDPVRAARRTLGGEHVICCDSGRLPTAVLGRALSRAESQVGRAPGGITRWISMNTTIAPFDNLNLRRAVLAGFDRVAVRRARGGELAGPLAESYLPPGVPGHDESGGLEGFTELDFMQHPAGDAALSQRYLAAAAKQGVPVRDGAYAGRGKVLLVTSNAQPDLGTGQVAASELRRLGFQVRVRKVPQDVVLRKFCGVPKAEVAICPNVGYQRDFFDAESILRPAFDGDAIRPAGNVNWSELDDDAIDRALDAATTLSGTDRNRALADVNRMIVAQAPAIPFVWDEQFQLQARDVEGVMNPYDGLWDLSFTSLK